MDMTTLIGKMSTQQRKHLIMPSCSSNSRAWR